MATKKIEEIGVKKEMPILKKRIAPGEISETEVAEKKSPLKKRTTPLDEPNAEKSVAALLKKKENPLDETAKPSPLKKKKNPLDEVEEEPKEKSSLDKMRERIAAQKKLEQDMMTQQSLRNQEKVSMRNKLSALSKDLTESAEEEEIIPKAKPVINTDLKTEALEIQNKKLKADLEKSKQQLQALLALEYQNMRVLDSSSLSLSNEFIDNLNSIKEQYENQKNLEEQTLKEELNALQKELADVKNKNAAAKKASDDARKAAAQAEKAIEEAKRVIEDQENDQIRNFKEEIKELEKQIKDKEKQLTTASKDKEKLVKEYDKQIEDLKSNLEKQVNSLTADKTNIQNKNDELINQVEQLKQTISQQEKQIEENNKSLREIEILKAKLEQQESDHQLQLQREIDKSFEQVANLEKQIQELESKNNSNEKVNEQKQQLEKELEQQANKIDELLKEHQKQLQAKEEENKKVSEKLAQLEKELENSKSLLSSKEKEIVMLNADISNLPTKQQVKELESKIAGLESNLKSKLEIESKYNSLTSENEKLQNKIKQLQFELEDSKIQSAKFEQVFKQNFEKQQQLQKEISNLQTKIEENNKVKSELLEQYNRFKTAEQKLLSSFAVVRKLNSSIKECELAKDKAKKLSEEVAMINAKTDKKAYKAKVAESKSMNTKALYLEKQLKKLMKNKNVAEYAKLVQKIKEFENQFEAIDARNNELKTQVQEKEAEIQKLKG